MKKIIIFIGITMLMTEVDFAQYHSLAIGDTIPNVAVYDFRHSEKIINIRDLCKGKLLLIDFCATWCAPCVKELPYLDSLKKEFGGKLEVLVVSFEKSEVMEDFYAAHPEIAILDMSVIADDTLLSKTLLPHRLLPHLAWIDSTGKLLYTTGGSEVNYENITSVILGKSIPMHIKKDKIDFDISKPFVVGDSDFLYRSVLTRYRSDQAGQTALDPTPQGIEVLSAKRVFISNLSIKYLYMVAAFGFKTLLPNMGRFVCEAKDSIKLFYTEELFKKAGYKNPQEYYDKNVYCYELTMPDTLKAKAFFKYMMDDLNRIFPFKGYVEKRVMPCYVVKSIGSDWVKSRTKGGKSEILSTPNALPFVIDGFQNQSMDFIVQYISDFNEREIPLINGTDNIGNLDLHFNKMNMNQHILMHEVILNLENNGFKVVKENRLIDVLVIKDKS